MKRLLITLVVLLGLAAAVDRVAVTVADRQVARQIQQQAGLAGAPDVAITGFPFLTQAIDGRYRDVRISLTAADLDQPPGTSATVALYGARVPLSEVVSGSVRSIPVDRVDGDATLSYGLLAAQLGGDTTLRQEGDGLRITRTVQVGGRTVPLTATGTVTLEGDVLAIDVHQASGVGVSIPPSLLRRAGGVLGLRYRIPPLPFGLRLTSVTPAADGVVVRIAAGSTVLSG